MTYEQKAAGVLKNRIAKVGFNMTDADAGVLVTMLKAQGWKLVANNADETMVQAAKEVTNGNDALRWSKMWEAA